MRDPIRIIQGGQSRTGKWIQSVWCINYRLFAKLTEAKEYAVDVLGASGKWVRSVERTGPRGKARAVYTEVPS